MPTYKFNDWIEDEIYLLIGIHTTLEPYRLAFLINKYLKTQFVRTVQDLDVTKKEYIAHYPVYKFTDSLYQIEYFLVANKYRGLPIKTQSSGGLFEEFKEQEIKVTLIKEFKTVDYFMKICTEDLLFAIKNILTTLQEIPEVLSAYQVDHKTIKQQDYLIFE